MGGWSVSHRCILRSSADQCWPVKSRYYLILQTHRLKQNGGRVSFIITRGKIVHPSTCSSWSHLIVVLFVARNPFYVFSRLVLEYLAPVSSR